VWRHVRRQVAPLPTSSAVDRLVRRGGGERLRLEARKPVVLVLGSGGLLRLLRLFAPARRCSLGRPATAMHAARTPAAPRRWHQPLPVAACRLGGGGGRRCANGRLLLRCAAPRPQAGRPTPSSR
jgi:hypothetical protein